VEEAFARAGRVVVSNARSHRMDADVPLLVPEVNPDHLALGKRQGWPGMILTNPNCSTIGLVLALKPLVDAFGVAEVHVVTMQALSGAGLPGVPGMRAVDNVVPFIGGEEEKMEMETLKILGRLDGGSIALAGVRVSATCNRVPVTDGHLQCVSVKLERPASADDVCRAWTAFAGEPQRLGLPSAPLPVLHLLPEKDAPQPRLHRDLGRGMAASVGRLRRCSILDWKFVTLSHNTVRGAAGGALLVAELAVDKGCLGAATGRAHA
jgi:aspartate-semialdehyde dehydrogenase